METLSFRFDPVGLTRTIRDFAHEGAWKRVVDIMLSSGVEDEEVIVAALQGRLILSEIKGKADEFDMEISNEEMETEFLVTGLRTLLSHLQSKVQREAYELYPLDEWLSDDHPKNKVLWDLRWEFIRDRAPEVELAEFLRSDKYIKMSEDLSALLDYVSADEMNQWITPEFILREKGYNVFTIHEYLTSLNKGENRFSYQYPSGVILENGTIVECAPQDHISLFPDLERLGLTDSTGHMTGHGDSPRQMRVIPLTAGHLGFGTATALKDLELKDDRYRITNEQFYTLFHLRDVIDGFTGSFRDDEEKYMIQILAHHYNFTRRSGSKYAYLYLAQMGGFHTPQRSMEWTPGVDCIRSSPSHSMPGVLNSYFNLRSSQDFIDAQNDMQRVWNETKESESSWYYLSYFYQKTVPGVLTGVGHWMGEGDLRYAVSPSHDALTSGKTQVVETTEDEHEAISNTLEQLGRMCGFPIQVEFTIDENYKVTILQLKPLKNTVEDWEKEIPEGAIPAVGFSRGNVYEASLDEVLVVDEDIDPKTSLTGVKAVIVRHETIFSHVLAMAQNRRIPAVYGVGEVELPQVMDIVVESKSAYIQPQSE